MAIVIATFALTAAFIFGAFWLFVGREEEHEARVLRRRLRVDAAEARRLSLLTEDLPLSSMPWLDRALARFGGALMPLRDAIERSALRITPGAVILACVFLMVAAFTAMRHLVPPVPLLALIAAPLAGAVPLVIVWMVARRRMRQFEAGFPAALDLVTRALRAGHAFSAAIELVGKEIPDPIGSEFRLMFERQNYGMSLEQSMRGFAARVPLLDARFFVTAVLTQREVGGNLSEVLENLARVIRERFAVRRDIRVASAHGRMTGWVLGLLAPVMAFVLFSLYPQQMMVLIDDPLGIRVVVLAIALQIVGVFAIRRLVNIEY